MRSLEVVQRNFGDVTVLEIKGWINVSAYQHLTKLIKELIAQGRSKFVFDYSEVEYVDSAGHAFPVAAYTAARNSGGSVKLAAANTRIRGLLAITKLLTVFETYDRTEDAVISFGADPSRPDGDPIVRRFPD